MKFYFSNLLVTGCLIVLPALALAVPDGKGKGVQVTSYAPALPVLRGVPANPMFCIRVHVPAGTAPVEYNSIHATVNKAGMNAIEQIDVFYTNAEPLFAAVNNVASLSPSATVFSIPVKMIMQPGMHYIWVSARLKTTAAIGPKIDLQPLTLGNISGGQTSIVMQGPKENFSKRIGVAVRKAGDDGAHTYRIPGITTTNKGTLVAVYDIRYKHSGDLPANIDVGMNRSTDGGNTWEPMKIIMDMGEPHDNNGVGDPAILFDPVTKKIWVAALWSKGNKSIAGSGPGLSPEETGQLVLVSSDDDGLTWSKPVSITPQVKNPKWNLYFNGPGNGIAMKNGHLVFASQYWDEKAMPHATIIVSDDHGLSWKSGMGAKANTTESQVVETTPGTLMLNMRDNRGGYRSIATTAEYGKSWVEHATSYSALQDPVCMASIIKASVPLKGTKREVLFFSNVNSSAARMDMTIKASLDLGETWADLNQLLIDERRCYGYSALTMIDENTIGLIYEGSRDLYFVRIPVNEILNNVR